MPEYYEMDARWEPHSITTKEEYEKQVVIKGYFHEGVPEDVVKEFTTAEYLMAHAFYYWLFWDEAFAKCLFILEMAVKLKAKQLGIEIEVRKKDGNRRNRRLIDIINEICIGDHHDMLKAYLHRARKLRNTVAHPEQHSFAGPHGLNRNIQLFIVTLNRLFREESWFVEQRVLRERIRKVFVSWGDKPIAIEIGKEVFLYTSIQTMEVFEEHLMVALICVLDVEKLGEKMEQPFTISYFIKDVRIEKGLIRGNSNDGTEIVMFPTEELIALKAVEDSDKYLERFSEQDRDLGRSLNTIVASWKLIDIEFEYLKHLYKNNKETNYDNIYG